jgi:hypothetical protein
MRGADGFSWNAIPPRIVPERGQVSEYASESSSNEVCNVLHDDVSRSKCANDPLILAPQARARSSETRTRSSSANVLTRESAADDIRLLCSFVDVSNVAVSLGGWVVLSKHCSAEVVDLRLPDDLAIGRFLNAALKPADAAEQ